MRCWIAQQYNLQCILEFCMLYLHKIESRTNYTSYFFNVFLRNWDLCYSQREKHSGKMHSMCTNSSAANLCIAKHNNFIFSSSGYKTRVEKSARRPLTKPTARPDGPLDRFMRRSSRVSSGRAAWIKIERATFGNAIVQKRAQWTIEGRNRDECEPTLGPLNVRT